MDNKIEQVKRITEILKPEMGFAHMYPNLTAGHLANQIYAALYSSQEPKVVPCKFEDWDDTQEPAICQCTLVDDFDTSNRCGHIGDVTDCPLYKPVSQSVSTPTEGMELSDEELELTVARILADCDSLTEVSDSVWELYRREAKEIIVKVLANLPTEQELKADITNFFEWKLKTTETMARESERKEIYAEISKDLNEAVILHNEIKPNGNVMVKGGFIAELQKKYVAKLRSLVIPKEV